MQIQSLGQEDPLEEGMATHCSVLAWRTPGAGEPGGLQSTGVAQTQTWQKQLSTRCVSGNSREVMAWSPFWIPLFRNYPSFKCSGNVKQWYGWICLQTGIETQRGKGMVGEVERGALTYAHYRGWNRQLGGRCCVTRSSAWCSVKT